MGDEFPGCPKCKTKDTIPIYYGLIDMWHLEMEMKSEIKIGEKDLLKYAPKWYCKKCKNEWGSVEDLNKI